jgi:predicted enzyme related to lactoylglutathione lyase
MEEPITTHSPLNAPDSRSRVTVISPMLPAAHLEKTLTFYREVLDFQVVLHSEAYLIVEKDGSTIHFMKAADAAVLEAVRGHMEIYIEVDDIGPLWNRVQAFRGKYKLTELADRDYGMTEFHILDPDGCLIFVGQETRQG